MKERDQYTTIVQSKEPESSANDGYYRVRQWRYFCSGLRNIDNLGDSNNVIATRQLPHHDDTGGFGGGELHPHFCKRHAGGAPSHEHCHSVHTPNLNVAETPETLTATVSAGATGSVTFFDMTTPLGTAPIVGNSATLIVPMLAAGTHTITAAYSGDAIFFPSTSSSLSLVVLAADFAVASSTPRQLIPPGASASYTVAVTSVVFPFTNAVTLSVTNLPGGASYTYSPASVIPGAGGANSTLTITVPKQTAALHRGGLLALAIFCCPLPRFEGRRADHLGCCCGWRLHSPSAME